jgi:hypothetical protein
LSNAIKSPKIYTLLRNFLKASGGFEPLSTDFADLHLATRS